MSMISEKLKQSSNPIYTRTNTAQSSQSLLNHSAWGTPGEIITFFFSQMGHSGPGRLLSKSVALRTGLWSCAHPPPHWHHSSVSPSSHPSIGVNWIFTKSIWEPTCKVRQTGDSSPQDVGPVVSPPLDLGFAICTMGVCPVRWGKDWGLFQLHVLGVRVSESPWMFWKLEMENLSG